MKLPYSGKILRGLKFAIFAIWLNLLTFHFVKCSPLNVTRQTLNRNCKTLILNEIGK